MKIIMKYMKKKNNISIKMNKWKIIIKIMKIWKMKIMKCEIWNNNKMK